MTAAPRADTEPACFLFLVNPRPDLLTPFAAESIVPPGRYVPEQHRGLSQTAGNRGFESRPLQQRVRLSRDSISVG
jgi:hypothetical protein